MNEIAQAIANSQDIQDAIAHLIGTVLLAVDPPVTVVGGGEFHQAIEQAIVRYLEGRVDDPTPCVSNADCPEA